MESSNTDLNINTATDVLSSLLAPEAPAPKEKATQPESTEKEESIEEEAEAPEAEAETEDSDVVDEENSEEDTEPKTVTIKIDGKEVEVTLDELKNGYQRQADYTRKTMEAAEQRKAAEAELNAAITERKTYAENLQRMQIQLESALQEQQDIDWQKLIDTDPQEYLKQQHLLQTRQAQLQRNAIEQQQVNAKIQAEEQVRYQNHLAEQQALLLAKLPEWKDDAKSKAEKTALREWLLDQGFDQKNVDSVSDAKAVIMARKAMLYDKMMSKAQAVAKKVSNLPQKVEKPGVAESRNTDKRSNAFQKLSKSGSIDDAAAMFASIL
jgi:hypothetical protein